ncbi:hypothetical protein [Hyphomicrobium sp.]|uniref:hypothetical protein n=1 Tax=Hyphomicrobium sp. TaxID=82 RepID=UPI002E377A87|nr:hypothetical protein [Hyphomicrobium sp.]HEX2839848.1 hypothetical protein [Hyphomicrobium sp.]
MGRLFGSLLLLSVTAVGALAAEEGSVTIGKAQGVKVAHDQCQSLWEKANPAKKPRISAGQAQPFIADVKAANTNGDAAIDQNEFMAACDKGLIKQSASTGGSATTGGSTGTEGAASTSK